MDIRVKNEACHSESVCCPAAGEADRKITVKEIAERAEINKTTFYSHYETLDALTAEMERQTVQLVCDNMGGAQQLLDTPEALCGRCLLISSRRPIISVWFLHQR